MVTINPSASQPLFVNGSFKQQLTPDANYLFSVIEPQCSLPGSSRRQMEENVMDYFKNCLNLFEDSTLVGYSAAVAWNYEENNDNLDCGVQEGNI